MKIIYILNQRFPTIKAYGIQVAKTCEGFMKNGVDVELVVPRRYDQQEIKGISPFDLYGVNNRFKITYLPALDFAGNKINTGFLFILQQTISALFAVFYMVGKKETVYSRDQFSLYLLSFFRGRKLFWEAHRSPGKINSFFYRRLSKKLTGLIAITNGLKQEFVRAGWPADKILVSADGVELDDFNIPETREDVRRKLKLPLDKKIVMYVGHLFEWKGADMLAEAAAKLIPDTLVVIGGGTQADVQKFKQARYGDNVRLEGFIRFALQPLYLYAADVLVLPNKKDGGVSEFYTSPIKLFSYMAARKPIVASDLPSLREILNENNSILVKPNDVSALVSGIEKALSCDILAQQISMVAFNDVSKYSWDKRAENILNFIKQ